jgi:ATP-dependent DNA ligase
MVRRDRISFLVSRKGKKFRQFEPLLKQVLRCLKGQHGILDGEMVTFPGACRGGGLGVRLGGLLPTL